MHISEIFLSFCLPLLLLLAGGYFLFLVGGRILSSPRAVLRGLREGGGGSTAPVRALCVALAGTLGVGNIAGVASAIALGGAGALFYMWLSAFLAIWLKYAEIVLAVGTGQEGKDGRMHGGAMYYIKRSFSGCVGKCLAVLFALACLLCAFSLGAMLQARAAADAVQSAFGISPALFGALLAVAALAVLLRGSARIEAACARLVPFVCVLFTVLSLAAIIRGRSMLPTAIASVFGEALSFKAVGGGVAGFGISRALRFGVARGIVSNEAGCGTAPIAHAAAKVKSPAQQGFWGIFEVFADTIVLCTLTGLVLLVSGVSGGEMGDVLRAYTLLCGSYAAPLLALSVTFFAFATVLCWAQYAGESVYYLTGGKGGVRTAAPLVALGVAVGASVAPALLWGLTDAAIALMALINVAALLMRRRYVKAVTLDYFTASECERQAAVGRQRSWRQPHARSSPRR